MVTFLRDTFTIGWFAPHPLRVLASLVRPLEYSLSYAALQGGYTLVFSRSFIPKIKNVFQSSNWVRRLLHFHRLLQENFFLLRLYLPDLPGILSNQLKHLKSHGKRVHFHPGGGSLADPKWQDWVRCYEAQKAPLYASVYYSRDLWLGNLWNVQTGYGRWQYILKDHLPDPAGKRILDLGANSGGNAIQLLRMGAREVVAVELKQEQIDLGGLLLEGFEWMDHRKYELKFIQTNMSEVPTRDLGRFDMVMALCSLYYLSDEDMAAVTEHAAAITDTFVLECNTGNLERGETHLYHKASVEYAVALLRNHGFPRVEVIGSRGYYRPLVIGRK